MTRTWLALIAGALLIGSDSVHPATGALVVDVFTSSEPAGMANAYLVSGNRDMVLIDAVQLRSEATKLADAVARSGKTLTTIFITHAHPDHYFGLDVLRERFPGARVVTTAAVADDIRRTGPQLLDVLRGRLGAEAPAALVIPDALATSRLEIEGIALDVREMSDVESAHLATLYLPSSKALFASDLVYSRTHLFLREKRIDGWTNALDRLATWATTRVNVIYPGHGPAGGVEIIASTRQYLRDFSDAVASGTAAEAERRMLARYPDYRMPRFLKDFSIPAFLPAVPR